MDHQWFSHNNHNEEGHSNNTAYTLPTQTHGINLHLILQRLSPH